MAKKRLNGEGPIVWHKGIGTAEGRTFLRVHLRAAGVLNTECQLQGCYARSPGHGQARSVHAAGTGSAATRCHMDAVWNDVLQGDAGAVSTALKISERRSRLFHTHVLRLGSQQSSSESIVIILMRLLP